MLPFLASYTTLPLTLRRDDRWAAEHLITQLQAICPPDSEVRINLSLLHIDLLVRIGDHTGALEIIERIAKSIRPENFDVATQVRLLIAKTRIYDKSGQPERGFSLAIRAASIAHRARYLSGLWE